MLPGTKYVTPVSHQVDIRGEDPNIRATFVHLGPHGGDKVVADYIGLHPTEL